MRQLLAGRRGEKKNRLPNKRESEKARNRSASAKWAGNKGKSSAHLRVKWTVDNINRGRCRWCAREGKFRAILFALRVSRAVSRPPPSRRPHPVFLRISLTSSPSHDSASRENTSRGIFRDAVSPVPRRKSLNAIKVFLEKILREVSSPSSKVNLLSETSNMEASLSPPLRHLKTFYSVSSPRSFSPIW